MRKLIYHVASSLDGSIANADDSFGCFMAEGDHITDYLESLKNYDDVVMGRRTFDVGLRAGVTNPYPHMTKYVFTRSMKESPHPQVHLVADGIAEFVLDLKRREGRSIYLCGGGETASILLAANLIDEIWVKLNPLLIGRGIPMFSWLEEPLDLELISSKTYRNGVLLLMYAVKPLRG